MRGANLRPGGEAADFAQYVATLTSDLARLAREHRLGTLAYLLDMARLEARTHAQETEARAPAPPASPPPRSGMASVALRFKRPGPPVDRD